MQAIINIAQITSVDSSVQLRPQMAFKRADWWCTEPRITLLLLFSWFTQGVLQEQCVQNLPTFRDQGTRSPSLLVGIQALIPEYEFTCSGVITQWGLSTERRGKHRVDLQVWRRMQEGVYHLVGTNSFNTQPEMGQKLLYLVPNTTNQIQVKPGDVVGFYLENNVTIVDDFAIQYKLNATGVTVQYKQENHPLEIIQASTLPVQFLNVAPILLTEIAIDTEETIPPTTPAKSTASGPTSTDESSTTDLSAIIVGTLIGVVIFVVAIAMLIVVAVCIRARRSRADLTACTKPEDDRTATNPNYTGAVSVMVEMKVNPAYGQGQFRNVYGYEVPITTSTCYTDQHVLSKPQDDSSIYEIPNAEILHMSGQHEYEELV